MAKLDTGNNLIRGTGCYAGCAVSVDYATLETTSNYITNQEAHHALA